jgi:hypothetical protein
MKPVAWMLVDKNWNDACRFFSFPMENAIPLYTAPIELEPADKVNDDLYKAWRQYTGWGIPSKKGEEEFTAQYHAFQAGWKYAILNKESKDD